MLRPAIGQLYDTKDRTYFTGERRDLINRLTADPDRKILEIGCGDGAAGAYAKHSGKCGMYVGVEVHPLAADLARNALDVVHLGDIELFELPYEELYFDVIIASEVLEHLVDPWSVLRRLHRHIKVGGRLYASSPNVAHISTLRMLLKGRWDLQPSGIMDRTHLRWFTPSSYAKMFEDTGYRVESIEPMGSLGPRANLANRITFRRLAYLFITQMLVTATVIDF